MSAASGASMLSPSASLTGGSSAEPRPFVLGCVLVVAQLVGGQLQLALKADGGRGLGAALLDF